MPMGEQQPLSDAAQGDAMPPELKQCWMFIGLAFGISWLLWSVLLHWHARGEMLNLGSAGPALAAMILSSDRGARSPRSGAKRWGWFLLLLLPCWAILMLNDQWRAGQNLAVHADF